MSGPVAVVVGDLNVDVIAHHLQPLHPRSDTEATVALAGGGSAANTACWLAALGSSGTHGGGSVEAALVAAVGDDQLASIALAGLRDAGVRWLGVELAGASTGACVVVVDGDGERTMLPQRGANDHLPADVVVAAISASEPSWVHLSAYALLHPGSRGAGLAALRQARAVGATVSVDVASAAPIAAAGSEAVLAWIDEVDVVFANEDEVAALGGEAAIVAGVGSLVAKRGPAGARWTDGRRHREGEAHPAEVVDTTGAGDAFAAGWIVAALGGAGEAEALDAALAAGARAVGQLGARPQHLGGPR